MTKKQVQRLVRKVARALARAKKGRPSAGTRRAAELGDFGAMVDVAAAAYSASPAASSKKPCCSSCAKSMPCAKKRGRLRRGADPLGMVLGSDGVWAQ